MLVTILASGRSYRRLGWNEPKGWWAGSAASGRAAVSKVDCHRFGLGMRNRSVWIFGCSLPTELPAQRPPEKPYSELPKNFPASFLVVICTIPSGYVVNWFVTDDRQTENRAGEQTPISQARKRMPNQLVQMLRALLVRGQCTC